MDIAMAGNAPGVKAYSRLGFQRTEAACEPGELWIRTSLPTGRKKPMGTTDHVVELVHVDEAVLDELVAIAVAGAAPDDVTPPLGDGWTSDRVAWLRAYHRERRSGFGGGGDEATSAIRFDGRIVGASRLHRTNPGDASELECGIWLAKDARGLGISHAVFRLEAGRAARAGATRLLARTTSGNEPAVRLLQRAKAAIYREPGGAVVASIELADVLVDEES